MDFASYNIEKLKNKSILITGGTGSFGNAIIEKLLYEETQVKKIVVYSRDELKQWNLQQKFPKSKFPQLRFFLGDIRDVERLKRAFEGIDYVIHAAALKQVPAAEYNPIEFIKTNVLGAENIIEASLHANVEKVIALSTDKAAAPINLYGATKLCSDKLFISANNIVGIRNLRFSIVRYGNVMGSRGSVIPLFMKLAKSGHLPITDERMTRFNISLDEGVNIVLLALFEAIGGEIIVPKIPSYKINVLAEAIGPSCKKEIIGLRPGEKIHEEMITASDSFNTLDLGKVYAIMPNFSSAKTFLSNKNREVKAVGENFTYNSGTNTHFLKVEEIRELISKKLDKSFQPI